MKNPIRILEVTKSTAGIGQYARWIANGVDRSRFEMTFVCLSDGGLELATDLNQLDGVRAVHVGMERYRIDPLGDARVAYTLRKLITTEHFDVIHAHASKPGFLSRVAAVGTGIPVIYCPNCFSFHDGVAPFKANILAAVERAMATHLTTYIQCVCNDEYQLARRYQVGNSDQLVTIHTGVEVHPFDVACDRKAIRAQLQIPQNALVMVAVARLNPQKAPLDFVRAAAHVHQTRPDIHFVWVGTGPLEADATSLVAQLKMSDVFHFAGERRDVPQLLQACDIFVLPSHWEGFSLAVLEAMAARLPIITTCVTGASEAVIDGLNGVLVPIGQPTILGQAMLDLAAYPEKLPFYGAESRRRVERYFTRQRMISQLETLYESAATGQQYNNKNYRLS